MGYVMPNLASFLPAELLDNRAQSTIHHRMNVTIQLVNTQGEVFGSFCTALQCGYGECGRKDRCRHNACRVGSSSQGCSG